MMEIAKKIRPIYSSEMSSFMIQDNAIKGKSLLIRRYDNA